MKYRKILILIEELDSVYIKIKKKVTNSSVYYIFQNVAPCKRNNKNHKHNAKLLGSWYNRKLNNSMSLNKKDKPSQVLALVETGLQIEFIFFCFMLWSSRHIFFFLPLVIKLQL